MAWLFGGIYRISNSAQSYVMARAHSELGIFPFPTLARQKLLFNCLFSTLNPAHLDEFSNGEPCEISNTHVDTNAVNSAHHVANEHEQKDKQEPWLA